MIWTGTVGKIDLTFKFLKIEVCLFVCFILQMLLGLLTFSMLVSRLLLKKLIHNWYGWFFVWTNFKIARPSFTAGVGAGASCSTEQLPGGGCIHSVETRQVLCLSCMTGQRWLLEGLIWVSLFPPLHPKLLLGFDTYS